MKGKREVTSAEDTPDLPESLPPSLYKKAHIKARETIVNQRLELSVPQSWGVWHSDEVGFSPAQAYPHQQ